MIDRWRAAGARGGMGLMLAGAALLSAPVGAAGQASFTACQVDGYEGPARCGSVAVPEDPAAPAGRQLSLNVVILEATGPDSARVPDPVFILDGGPGQAATRSVEWVAEELAVVLATREVVMVDRRGTGGSNPLDCPGAEAGEAPSVRLARDGVETARACLEALEGRADLTKYTTPYAVDDLEAVREALGYGRINLYGGSYGSREAFEYMRRHGRQLRSAVVFAITPSHRRALLNSPVAAETAVQRLIDDCMADAACRGAYPDLRRELRAVSDRLASEPGRFTVPLPGGDRSRELELTRSRFGALVRSIMLSPAGGAQVPYLIHSTYKGNYEEVGGLYVRLTGSTAGALSRGLFLSAVCAEEMAGVEPASIDSAAEGTFWGASWPRSIKDQCELWPTGDLPADWHAPPEGNAPFLLLAGWLDPIAEPGWARELTRWMPNARRVVVREGHHNFSLDACGRRTLARFYDTADPFNLDVDCIASVERPAFLVR